jgi:hypothetical protein
MNIVEQIYPGFQWAEPLDGKELDAEPNGSDLQITGWFPVYRAKDSQCDLIQQYEKFPKQLAIGRQRTGTQSPEMCFANAETDEKLIVFVRRFGPVVAKCVEFIPVVPERELRKPRSIAHLIAQQDMRELRNEHAVYRAALALVMQLQTTNYDYVSAQQHMKIIAANIKEWPRQWEREKFLGGAEPKWKLSKDSLERITSLSSAPRDPRLPAEVDGRVVLCELLNSFRSTVFPNPLEMHSSIKFGIRPLLYSILRQQFIYPRGFSICPNSECRNFFNIERAGQQFCSPECSLHQRQRDYWQNRGKKLRKKRADQRRRPRK